jgi:hypothetical protein
MSRDPLIYSQSTGYIKGINLPGQKWEFHKRWWPNEFALTLMNRAKQFARMKPHEGGWELNGELPTADLNQRMSFFYENNMLYHKFADDGTLQTPDDGDSASDAWSYTPGTVYFYFGDPVKDGDYPRGRLSDEALKFIDPTNLNTIPIVKLVPDPYTYKSKWKSITLRPEDLEFARTGIREHAPAPAPAPAPPNAPYYVANAARAGAKPSAGLAALLRPGGRRRGGVRKTKARRSVKKRRTVRRSRQ